MKRYIVPFAALLALSSCKTKPVTDAPISTTASTVSDAAFFKKINQKTDFRQLKINSRITAETGNYIPPLDATIYLEKDRKIWINLVAIFLNVGRGIATQDGIKGYEKWNKTYIESDFTYLNKLLNVNFIDYSAFQDLLLGKTFIPVNTKDFAVMQNAQGYQLKSQKNLRFVTDGVTTEYSAVLDYDAELHLTKVALQQVQARDYLEITYNNWESFENIQLPRMIKMVIKGKKDSQILIENTKFDAAAMQTPYQVPANYTKTEIK